tara:strand:- start:117 stop:542 length:426 start_codon:yes stop_codon:yes gene_type:complete
MSIFIGGTGSANELDDYEEGSFTPTVFGTNIGGYNEQYGKYVKIGKLVTVNIRMRFSANTNSNNAFGVAGLPFTSAGNEGDTYGSGGITYCDIPLNNANFDPYITNNSTLIYFYQKITGDAIYLASNCSNKYLGLAAFYYV